MFKVNSRDNRTRCEICSKLTEKSAFIINFEQVSSGWVNDLITIGINFQIF